MTVSCADKPEQKGDEYEADCDSELGQRREEMAHAKAYREMCELYRDR